MNTTEHAPVDSLSADLLAMLDRTDPDVATLLRGEAARQSETLELIASENHVSSAVMHAAGTWMTNKYAEGYPGRRYYGGCEYMDVVEDLARDRAQRLFGCDFANVQAHSGSQANQAAYAAVMNPGDTLLGMSLSAGGHLSHGAAPNLSGKWFNAVQYGVRREDAQIDFDEVAALAREHKPAVIVAGGSAYPRVIDFGKFRAIADQVGAYLIVDMAHFAGLVAGGAHPSPFPHAHIVTTTTHKTLRGPRGGMVLTNDADFAKKINSMIFPFLQGGPLMHVIAAKAAALGEALAPEFRGYASAVVENARTLAATLAEGGLEIVSGSTDTHLMLVDLRSKGLTGKVVEEGLEAAHITCNKNGIPFDPEKPTVTSGVRLGTPAGTTRGFGVAEFREVGQMIIEVLDGLASGHDPSRVTAGVKERVIELCGRFPIYKM